MDIGGTDVGFRTRLSMQAQWDAVCAYFAHIWPQGVVEEIDGENEYLIYKDAEARRVWALEGRTDEHAADQIHVLCEPHHCTVVHELLDFEERHQPQLEKIL